MDSIDAKAKPDVAATRGEVSLAEGEIMDLEIGPATMKVIFAVLKSALLSSRKHGNFFFNF